MAGPSSISFLKILLFLYILSTLHFLPTLVWAAKYPDKPLENSFFVDQAKLLKPLDSKEIDQIAGKLLQEERIPIFVVTITSLASYEAVGLSIENYAEGLFNEWGIGFKDRNNGMLLLISKLDRKARIELGADWGHQYDQEIQTVMNTLIIPRFKKGEFSLGILEGVRGMEAMARGLQLPKPKPPWWFYPVLIGGAILIVLLVYNLFKSGRKGWAWAVIIAVGVMLWFVLRNAGGGGGFGGGSSGGGGATGSW